MVESFDVAVDSGSSRYIIASFPGLRQINWLKLPDTNWRPLVLTDLQQPEALAVDSANFRLFVSDPLANKIFWYQMQVMPDASGTLITDGLQHVAVTLVSPRNLAVSPIGDLWFAGYKMPITPSGQPNPLAPTTPAIFKQSAIVLATTPVGGVPADPIQVWGETNAGENTIAEPQGIALDAQSVYWTNSRDGSTSGSVVKAAFTAPALDPSTAVHPLADNVVSATSVVQTPTSVFYASRDGIFGVAKGKSGMECTSQTCVTVSQGVSNPTAMVWDGEGTIYVADAGGTSDPGKIITFPSSTVSEHLLENLLVASGIHGMALLKHEHEPVGNLAHTSSRLHSGVYVIIAAAMLAAVLS